MKTLISQKDFADKVGISPSQLSRDFVKKDRLPIEGKKIVMPDAEKIFYSWLSGNPKYLESETKQTITQPGNRLEFEYEDGSSGEITLNDGLVNVNIPTGKPLNLLCNNLKIELWYNSIGNYFSRISQDGTSIKVESNQYQATPNISIDLDDLEIAIIDDDKKAAAIAGIDDLLSDPDNNYYLITKSELMEVIKSKFVGDKRYL